MMWVGQHEKLGWVAHDVPSEDEVGLVAIERVVGRDAGRVVRHICVESRLVRGAGKLSKPQDPRET